MKKKRFLAFALALIMVLSLMPTIAFATDATKAAALEKGSRVDGTDYKVTSVKNYSIAPDITERVITTNNDAGTSQTVANVMEVDVSNGNAKIVAGYGNRNPKALGWTMMTTTNQAHVYEKETGENVVGGINASWFNIDTGEPSGYLVMNGVVHHNSSHRAYVAAFSDGSVNVFKEGTTLSTAEAMQSEKQGCPVTVIEAVDALVALVWDGKIADAANGNGGYYPRSAIGVKADGTVVILQADGTMAPRSVGYTAEEEAQMMLSLGCVAAIQLDEGGSSTYISQREGEKDLSMRNTPAGGSERTISGSILVVSTVKASGEFHHVNVTPNEEHFTPNSSVELKAEALDYSGASVSAMPEDVCFVLADSTMGDVTATTVSGRTATATFTATDKTGVAVVNVVSNEKVVGKATINIQNPDELSFTSKEVNLVYGETSTLGLNAKYLGEPVNLKAGDITWSISDETAGSFEGIAFTATTDKKYSGSPTITANYGDLSASVSVNVGKQPVMVMDGGDEDIWNYTSIGNTVESFDGMAADAVATFKYAGRGGVVKGSIVSDTDEEYADIVRFGHNAIKLEYDWRGLAGTDGACLGLGQPLDIDGTPTAIGVWVYIPDDTTPVPWLRAQVATSTNGGASWTNAYINFSAGTTTGEGLKPGWQYLEADLTQYAGAMIRVSSGMLFRAMVTTSGIGWCTTDGIKLDKSELTGYIIIDNVSIVYGSNNQDVTPPTVNSISIVNADGTKTELEDGAVLNTCNNRFFVSYNDNEETDENATGVESAYFYFDGIYRGVFDKDNLGSTSPVMQFGEGQHSITFYLKDGYGNVTRETRYFTIESDDAALPNLKLENDGNPTVNEAWHHYLTSDRIDEISQISATFSVTRTYPVSNVEFPAGVVGTWNYNAAKGILDINITSVDKEVFSSDYYADIIINIPKTIFEGSSINTQVTKATYVCAKNDAETNGEDNSLVCSYSTPLTKYDIESAYSIKAETVVKGSRAYMTVTVINDKTPAVGLKVYANNKLIGLTNDNGQVEISGLITELGSFNFYAVDNKGKVSYSKTVYCYDAVGAEDGAPYYIHNNIPNDASTEKNISWMCNPTCTYANALMLISTSEDMSNAWDVAGSSRLISYSASNQINRVNSVYVTGLTPGTTYYYQVGDGYIWSDVKSFTTAVYDGKTNFFLVADIQEDDAITGMQRIGNCLNSKAYDFGAQLGDAVDNVRYYEQWDAALNLFDLDSIKDVDMLHVIGNHEADDSGNNAIAAKSVFNCNNAWYSFERGDVYVAVLNYTSNKENLEQFAEWLVADANASDCTWKVVMTHVPAYYTNPTGGGDIYINYLPAACDAAGIDFYFAGNDHSYARTAAMVNGEKNVDGTVYYICGSTGGKSYSIVNNPEFNFEVATLDFESVYIDVSADQYQITVTAYNIDSNGEVSVLDQYVKRAVPVCDNDEHSYTYDRITGTLFCPNCGTTCNAVEELYSGWATDKETGYAVFLASGVLVKGDMRLNTTVYYFDKNGISVNGDVNVCGEVCNFKDGVFVGSQNSNVRIAGFVGLNIQWVLYNDGNLYISGSGKMEDATVASAIPWSDFRKQIVNVTIDGNITSLSNFAFYKCTALTNVSFEGDSKLISIGKQAFLGCTTLKSFDMPNTVSSIGSYAFNKCTSLESVIISDSIRSVSSRMFEKCTALKSVYMPDGITQIAGSAFNNCPNVVLSVAPNSYAMQFAIDNNIRYEVRAAEVLYGGNCGENATWALYSDGVLKIEGSGAMTNYAKTDVPWFAYRNQITDVVISKDITSISDYAFYKEAKLASVSFEEGSKLESIGKQAFLGDSVLKEFVMPNTVGKVGSYTFSGCTALENVELSENLKTLSSRMFENCTSLKNVYMPENVSKIVENSTFYNCPNVVLSVAPNSYAMQFAIDNNIRYEVRAAEVLYGGNCGENATWALYSDGVLKIEGSGAMTNYAKTDVPWFAYRNQITDVVISKDITSISDYAFYKEAKLASVSFEEGSKLESIGKQAFLGDSVLKEFVMPNTVGKVGSYTFSGCTALGNVELSENLKTLSSRMFENCTSLKNVYMPENVSKIVENSTFYNCPNVVLSVANGSYAETWAKTNGISCSTRPDASGSCGENLSWALLDGVLTISGKGDMTRYDEENAAPWSEYAKDIKSVVIEKNVTLVGAYAFFGLTELENVIFAEDCELITIEDFAFAGCEKIKEIALPEKLETIGEAVFANCKELTKVVFGEAVKEFGNRIVKLELAEGEEEPELVAVFDGCNTELEVFAIENSPIITTLENVGLKVIIIEK